MQLLFPQPTPFELAANEEEFCELRKCFDLYCTREEQEVLLEYYAGATLLEVGSTRRLSRERIRQIREQGLAKIRRRFGQQHPDPSTWETIKQNTERLAEVRHEALKQRAVVKARREKEKRLKRIADQKLAEKLQLVAIDLLVEMPKANTTELYIAFLKTTKFTTENVAFERFRPWIAHARRLDRLRLAYQCERCGEIEFVDIYMTLPQHKPLDINIEPLMQKNLPPGWVSERVTFLLRDALLYRCPKHHQ